MDKHNPKNRLPKVAVITPTVGRAELERAILSVKAQSFPCQHYVFVDGEQFHETASQILSRYPDVIAYYLPINTGAKGWINSSINAAAPFLVEKDVDILCYLDDDNWFTPEHIALGVASLNANPQASYAFSLRNLYDLRGNFLCLDTFESLGVFQRGIDNPTEVEVWVKNILSTTTVQLNTEQHLDTNCYFFYKDLACELARVWYSGIHNDRHIFAYLQRHEIQGVCTQQATVNYTFDSLKFSPALANCFLREPYSLSPPHARELLNQVFVYLAQKSLAGWGGRYPWQTN